MVFFVVLETKVVVEGEYYGCVLEDKKMFNSQVEAMTYVTQQLVASRLPEVTSVLVKAVVLKGVERHA